MKIQCPQCAVIGSVDDAYLGKKVKCPKCGEKFVVAVVPEEPVDSFLEPSPPPPPEMVTSPDAAPVAELAENVPPPPAAEEFPETEYASSPLITEEPEELPDAPATAQAPHLPSEEVSDVPRAEPEETIDWSDIVSEMDKDHGETDKRALEGDMAPASFDQGVAVSPGGVATGSDEEPPGAAPLGEVTEPDRPKEDEPTPDREEISLAAAIAAGTAALVAGADDKHETTQKIVLDGVQQEPYGMEKEQCWQCGKKDSVGVPFIAKDGRLYCPDCLPAEVPEPPEAATAPRQAAYGFSIGGLLREAWDKIKGVKGAIWAGSAIMYVVLIIVVAGGAMVLPQGGSGDWNPVEMVVDILFQLVTNAVMVIFSAGLINIAIRKLAGDAVGWRMVFDGFPVAGKLIVAGILQSLLIFIGFLLLILPGIYLSVGYCMTIPLIVDRQMSPWQAMEASRKAVHERWWKIFGLFIVMGLICFLASLPLGIGLIWAWPMFVVLGALVYRSLFGIARKAD